MTTSTDQDDSDEQGLEQQPFVAHLIEFTQRLKRVVMVIFAIFVVLFHWATDLYTLLASPLISHLPEGTGMIATKVIAPFLTPLKLTFVLAIFLSIPFTLYQFWAFVAPGLYQHEKRLASPLVVSSALLFYLGMAFAYFVVFPLLFDILPSMAPDQITVAPDITDYLDFVLTLFFAFGVAFEVPIATIVLVWMGMTTPEALREKRPYIVIGAFCVGMLLTPPDVISQTLLAVPMLILFELGVFFSRFFERDREEEEPLQPGAPTRDDGDISSTAKRDERAPALAPNLAGVRQPTHLPLEADDPGIADAEDEQDAGPADKAPSEFRPVTAEELSAQLDAIEAEDDEWDEADDHEEGFDDDWDESDDHEEGFDDDDESADGEELDSTVDDKTRIDAKLELVMEYRNVENEDAARTLLYEVLAEGDDDQIRVARNILQQLDSDFQ
jgi:sec-independent protein translocase protein TatC